jgi:hypothetical protein
VFGLNSDRLLTEDVLTVLIVGRAMAQAVSGQDLAEAQVRARFSPCGISAGKSGTGTGFSRVLRFYPVNDFEAVQQARW